MENITLFESFLIWLNRNKREFTVTTGIVYGHKIYKHGRYTFIELSPTEIGVSADDFYFRATNYEELIMIAKAIR